MSIINVIKSNGEKELFNYDKITRNVLRVCEGVANIDANLILKNTEIKVKNNIKTSDIQNALIKTALELIPITKNVKYDLIASRFLYQKMFKEVYPNNSIDDFIYVDIFNSICNRIKNNRYDLRPFEDNPKLYDILKECIKLTIIGYNYSYNLEYAALNQLYSKYLIKHNGKLIELPQEMFLMVMFYNFCDHYRDDKLIEIVKEGFFLLRDRKISLPTPIMNGLRTNYRNFISCNLINLGDSVTSLSKGVSRIMECTARKSGLGINASFIRGLGAPIGNPVRVYHTGILPLLKVVEAATCSLTQISRGGSANVTIPFYHYEVELFCQLGDSKGTAETRTRHLDQTIIINKWFLDKCLKNEDIYLFYGNVDRELYDNLGDYKNFNIIYNNLCKNTKNKKKINSMELLKLFLYERSIVGRVYFVFADNFCKSSFKEKLYMTNLCCEISVPNKPLDYSEGVSEIGCCILGNMNLGYTKKDEIPEVANFLVNFLDLLIENSGYTIPEVEYAAKNRRTLGIGISNLFGYFAEEGLSYNTAKARDNISELMELFYFHLVKASNGLAKERGKCLLYDDTIYSDGIFIHDIIKDDYKIKLPWDELRKDVLKYGLRHSSLVAIPPASNSSIVSNSTAGVEPPRELITTRSDKYNMYFKLVPNYEKYSEYYTTAWSDEFNNIDYFKLISRIQRFTDQSISLNQYTKGENIKIYDILKELIFCMNNNIKSWYYQNFNNSKLDKVESLLQEKDGCGSGGCQV